MNWQLGKEAVAAQTMTALGDIVSSRLSRKHEEFGELEKITHF